MSALFDSDQWREAIPLEGAERRHFLIRLFEDRLKSQGQVNHVKSFELHTRDGNDYRLVFATGHDRGLELMKEAMWAVDPEAGTAYVAHTDTGQQVLFGPQVDTRPLLAELRAAFADRWFTMTQAEQVTMRTDFLVSRHLKRMTLVPAERAGVIEVVRPAGARAGTFTESARIRFRG